MPIPSITKQGLAWALVDRETGQIQVDPERENWKIYNSKWKARFHHRTGDLVRKVKYEVLEEVRKD